MVEKKTECLLVSVDFSNGVDSGVMIVGRKKKGVDAEIINAFQGKEAMRLYKRLITQKKPVEKVDGVNGD